MINPSNVFIIDDDEMDRAAIIRSLRGKDFQCVEFQSGEKGLEGLTQKPDIILLDHNLTDMDGISFLEEVKAGQLTNSPIIMLTGSENPDIIRRAQQLGVQDYLVKGEYTGDMLIRSINYAIERKKLEIELIEAKEKAESANKAKSEFLSSMSHELRTPLTVMLGYLPLLQAEKLPPADMIRQFCSEMQESGTHLLGLINDILDISKMEAGQYTLHKQLLLTSTVIEEVFSTFKIRADNKDITLVADSKEIEIFADPLRLKQILINLVSNSLKFTEKGSITVSASRSENGVDFQVTDTGCGIPEKVMPFLFERFYQVDSSSTRSIQGTGLGLAITKRLVELHGGNISVSSVEDEGTTFTFCIWDEE